jgi:hypothetical protein
MAARRSTSKKQSAAKAAASTLPLKSVTFFTDRGLGAFDVPNALRAFGLNVEIHKAHFNSDCEDHVWIESVGRNGWIILTKDKHLRSRQIEVAALMKSNTATFVLANSNATGPQNAETFIKAMPQIFQFIQRFTRPFMAKITPNGSVELVLTHEMMIETYSRFADDAQKP